MSKTKRFTLHWRKCVMAVTLTASVAAAQADVVSLDFNLPAQTLQRSLDGFTGVTGIRVVLDVGVSGTLNAPPVQGKLAPTQALDALLRGTGLSYRFVDDKTVRLSRAVDDGSRVTGTLRVEGSSSNGTATGAAAGPNGSSDSTATEGTHSLAGQSATIGSKTPLALKDTTQSVSVVTRQQIEDQHLDSLAAVLDQAAGVTVNTGQNFGGNANPGFYSRGFQIQTFQIDGGAPLTTGNANYTSQYIPIFDISQYDHVEVLRGADGLYSGVGDPGGIVSLTRKRPLDHQQILLDAEVGSFAHRRVSLDATAPVLADGSFSARAVLTHDDSPFFYGDKKNTVDMGYLNLEYKPLTGTQINLGGSVTQRDLHPWSLGLPRGLVGNDLKLSRDLCLCLDENVQKTHQVELFAQLHQTLAKDWSLAVNVTRSRQFGSVFDGEAEAGYSGVPPDGSGLSVFASIQALAATQTSIDATVSGEFEAFGHRHQVTFGADRATSDGQSPNGSITSLSWDDPANVYTFNPGAYPVSTATVTPQTIHVLAYSQSQSGLYGTLRLNPFDAWHLTLGLRYSDIKTNQITDYGYAVSNVTLADRRTLPPFVSLAYDLTPSMSAYASYASIYQSQANKLTVEQTPLGPTTGSNYELGLKRSDFGSTLQSSLALYHIERKNIGVQDPNAPFPPPASPTGESCCYLDSNSNKDTSQGVDLEVKGALTSRWQIASSYTYNINKYEPGPTQIYSTVAPLTTFAPKHTVKLWTTYALPAADWWMPVQVGGGARVLSNTFQSGSVCNADYSHCATEAFTQGGYALVDLMARWRLTRYANLQLNVKNVFDRTYFQSIGGLQNGNWYGEPRDIKLALNLAF